jgi:hypothetical protein
VCTASDLRKPTRFKTEEVNYQCYRAQITIGRTASQLKHNGIGIISTAQRTSSLSPIPLPADAADAGGDSSESLRNYTVQRFMRRETSNEKGFGGRAFGNPMFPPSRLIFHDSWKRCENKVGVTFQHPSRPPPPETYPASAGLIPGADEAIENVTHAAPALVKISPSISQVLSSLMSYPALSSARCTAGITAGLSEHGSTASSGAA